VTGKAVPAKNYRPANFGQIFINVKMEKSKGGLE
jgi:hypothetical protein